MSFKSNLHKPITDKKIVDILKDDATKEKDYWRKQLWYSGRNLNRRRAESVLLAKEWKHGTFLVRESFSSPGDYVLSVRVETSKTCPFVRHFKIIKNQNDIYYSIHIANKATPEFLGLENLISNYQSEGHDPIPKLEKCVPGQQPPAHSVSIGRTNILHKTITDGSEDNVLLILKNANCPNINSKNSDGQAALHLACEQGMIRAVGVMLNLHVMISSKNKNGFSALHIACQQNKLDIAKMLLEKGKASPVDTTKQLRLSPLHLAAREGHLECVKLLLTHGAPDRPRDISANTPYDLAKESKKTDVMNFLDNYTVKLPSAIKRTDWYHKNTTRQKAEEMIRRIGESDGAFLVRKSSTGKSALTVCFEMKIFHYEIKDLEGLIFYIDDGPLMTSIESVVYHYCRFINGLCTCLKTAISEDEKLTELDFDSPAKTDSSPPSPSVVNTGDSYELCGDGPATANLPVKPATEDPIYDGVDDPLEKFLIPQKSIQLDNHQELGQGEFGSVIKGVYTDPNAVFKRKRPVAVKTLINSNVSNSKELFLKEARVMCELHHPNIVKLIGICYGPPLMIVQELIAMGSLLDFLWDNPDQVNPDVDICLWAAQVADGMRYLEEKKFVHRDLAARNILLESKTLAKISDFGLSRAVSNYSDTYEASQGGRWPVKWYAPESINYGTFSHASDVWSYGVTLYEMYSLGEQPYGEKSGAEVLALIEKGDRLPKPDNCPQQIYELMLKCWSYNDHQRPTFQVLFQTFHDTPTYSRAISFIEKNRKVKVKH